MNKKIFLILSLAAATFVSCSNDDEFGMSGNKAQVTFSVDEFKNESGTTKTDYDPDNSSITWADGDTIGIFPRDNFQEPFVIPANQVGQSNAVFDGGYWALKNGKEYNAYYPFNRENYNSSDMITKIPVTYTGQVQEGTDCTVGAFDYTYSDWKTSTSGKSLNFSFHHIGSFLTLNLTLPATGSYTSLTLKTTNAVIPTQGTYDLTADSPAFIATGEKSDSLTLNLKNFTGTAGEEVTFYMMVPPMDLSEESTSVELSNGTESCMYTLPDFSINMEAAYAYVRQGTPSTSEITGTIDGWNRGDTTPYLTFSAASAQTVCFMDQDDASTSVATMEYSLNGRNWRRMGTNTITFGGINGNLRLRGKSSIGTATSTSSYAKLSFGDSDIPVSCSGDIRTLVDYSNYTSCDTSNARFCYLFLDAPITSAPELPAMTLADYCYASMFHYCEQLTTAPTLPATTLADYCYNNMFFCCGDLTTAPTLPATTLADYCYAYMFDGCTSLTAAPGLPAATLAARCYAGMFSHCTSLTTAPELQSDELASGCYTGMFLGCTSLTTAPELPALTLASGCYSNMFQGCTSLTTAPELPAEELASSCYGSMFRGCTSLTATPVLLATKLASTCYLYMFRDCTSLTTVTAPTPAIPALPAYTLAEDCYNGMFWGCTSLTTAPELPATALATWCYGKMFQGCTSLTTAPALPATILAERCYISMFDGCTNLTTAPTLPATTLTHGCYANMFLGCTSLTTAPELPATTLVQACYSFMFNGCSNLSYIKMMAKDISATQCLSSWVNGVSSTGTFVMSSDAFWIANAGIYAPSGWTIQYQ